MDSTSSLSKGCFAFAPKSSEHKRRKQVSQQDEFEDFKGLPQVSIYNSIIKNIEGRLKEINKSASDEVLQEVLQFVSKCTNSDFAIPTAVLLTGVNLPDHQVLFQDLAERVRKEVTQHVSMLLSSECTSVKNSIEQLTSQFLRNTTLSLESKMDFDSSDSEEEEVFDDIKRFQCTMPNLVDWYNGLKKTSLSPKKRKSSHPSSEKLVIIIPDFEGFSSKVLQDVILILSGYLQSLPLVLVIGVATSVKALQCSLPHRITSRMDVQMFQSSQSVHFLNNTVNEVFLSCKSSQSCPFLLGPKMFKFLTDVFIFYDFSVHGFIQGIKYCLMEHFYNSSFSKLCCSKEQVTDVVKGLDQVDINNIWDISSFRSYVEKFPQAKVEKFFSNNKLVKDTVLDLMRNLQDHKEKFLVAVWLLHALVHDLPETPFGRQVREVYIEVMTGPITENTNFVKSFELLNLMSKQNLLQKIDDMRNIIETSGLLEDVKEELLSLRDILESAGQNVNSPLSSPTKREHFVMCSDRKTFREKLLSKSVKTENEFEKARSKLLTYLKNVFADTLVLPSTMPLHEVILVENLSAKRHIVGAPRAALHIALNNPHHYLQCECCSIKNNSEILSTMPDVCIAYKLHLESQSLINMYDWLQSFVTIVSPEDVDRDERKVDPAIQARFTRAVSELQFLGFIKSSKKKTDHVTRLTWGGTS